MWRHRFILVALVWPLSTQTLDGIPPVSNSLFHSTLFSAVSEQQKSKADYRNHVMIHQGDAAQGRELFFDEQRISCSKCHTVDGSAKNAGPDLFAVGDKFGRLDLLNAVIEPNTELAIGYETTRVETSDGEMFDGVLKKVTNSSIELIGADAKPVRISVADIEEQFVSDTSLMPEGLESLLSLSEFADLIEYLTGLKQLDNMQQVAHGMPDVIEQISLEVEFIPFHNEDLAFDNPVWFSALPGVPNTFLVLEHQTGRIWRLESDGDHAEKTLFLDLGNKNIIRGSKGLLGLAFHPDFLNNRKYYLALHISENGRPVAVTVERKVSADLRTDSGQASKRIVVFDAATNANTGGCLEFGPDGYLYIGMGDTGPVEDPNGNGQNRALLLGKLLRIDVDQPQDGRAYGIPSDNPFIRNNDIRSEIWALGLREPWRFTFDPLTEDLWVGDVGQYLFEEVCIVRSGENHGWNVYEGFLAFSNQYRKDGNDYVAPVFSYGRKYGPSITGGYVYRGDPASSFYGVYIFGDYQSRRVWGLTQENRVLKKILQLGVCPQRVVSFGRDGEGNIYAVGYEGTIFRLNLEETSFDCDH